MKKILFISPYPPGTAPSQRFRFEQYLSFLKDAGYHYKQISFLSERTWEILYKPGYTLRKAFGIWWGFVRRKFLLFTIFKYDYVFIHREASPIGPPVFEWIIANVLRKKIIYDFDDAIWLPNTSATNKIVAGIKWHHKVSSICKWAYKVSCGNEYLSDFARKNNSNVITLPTTIDLINVHNQTKQYHSTKGNEKLVLGWTGTHSTIGYLEPLIPVLHELEKKYRFEFIVISNLKPTYNLQSLKFIPWNKSTEIDDLIRFDLGLMPLVDDQWAMGKCGFKALQYMSLGIPAVVSPVGVNTTIVSHLKTGFICNSPEEWKFALEEVLNGKLDLSQMGREAQRFITEHYSVQSQKETFLNLFK